MATAPFGADKEIGAITITDVVAEVPSGNIAIYVGDTVELHRQVEITTAWKKLWNGIRDRNLIGAGDQFDKAVIYTGVDVNSVTEYNRRTESIVASFTDNDIIIAIGAEVTTDNDATNLLEVAFIKLINTVKEQNLKIL